MTRGLPKRLGLTIILTNIMILDIDVLHTWWWGVLPLAKEGRSRRTRFVLPDGHTRAFIKVGPKLYWSVDSLPGSSVGHVVGELADPFGGFCGIPRIILRFAS